MKILVDANIALDVLLQRQSFYVSATKVLGLSKGGIELFISASTITDIYYIVRRGLKSKETAIALLKNLLTSVDIAAVTGSEIRQAIDLEWSDFEDAVQYATGENIAVDYIVTRNTSDYTSAALPVVTPDELLGIIISNA
uniref:PIN domain protein n=1 Tax=uncultured bacterium contig00109 TaxID=1181574 RepID=A0A806KH80_9BACT|nr:PIN domain protein [uncultured bacterium contig00109]